MRRVQRNFIMLTLTVILAFTGCSGEKVASAIIPITNAEAKEAKGIAAPSKVADCTIGTAEKYVVEQLKLTVNGTDYLTYWDALVNAKILLPTELTDPAKSMTKGELALLASRIMTYKGEKEDSKLSEEIISKKRISDLSKIEEPYKSCVVQVFGEGVMVGSSNGMYSQDRKFNASEAVTAGDMKSAILKALGEKDRSILSPEGNSLEPRNYPRIIRSINIFLLVSPINIMR